MAPFSTCFLVVIASVCIAQVHSDVGLYWLDFNGDVPEDAVSAGFDKYNNEYFVGQALGFRGEKWAISPVTIVRGEPEYNIPLVNVDEPKYTNKTYAMRVLCSTSKNNYKWVATNYLELAEVKNIVQGGWGNEHNAVTPLYIGRVTNYVYPIVGRIQSQYAGLSDNYLVYVYEDKQLESMTYEVLTYQD